MKKTSQKISSALKKAITESGISYLELERLTDVQRLSISRFMSNRQSLRLDKADILFDFFGFEGLCNYITAFRLDAD